MGVGTKHSLVVTFVESEESDTTFSSLEEAIEQAGGHIVSDAMLSVEVDEYGWEIEA